LEGGIIIPAASVFQSHVHLERRRDSSEHPVANGIFILHLLFHWKKENQIPDGFMGIGFIQGLWNYNGIRTFCVCVDFSNDPSEISFVQMERDIKNPVAVF
jgi:hypothetical protein